MATTIPEHSVLVAIPAFNEEASLPAVINRIRSCHPGFDILVVDDGSTDGTSDVARGAGVHICRLPFNLGVGGAMRTAFRYAQMQGYDALVQVDADGQHDAAEITQLIDRLQDADVVVGARFAGAGDYVVGFSRRSVMRILARVVSRLAGVRLTDVTSGFRVSNRRAIGVFALHYPSEYLGDTVESLVIGLRAGLSVNQVPVIMAPRFQGRPSQSSARSAVYLLRATAALILALVRPWPVPGTGAPGDVPGALGSPT